MPPYWVPPRTLEEIAADQIWIYKNWEYLCESHPRQMIGVMQYTIMASAASFGHLNERLKRQGLRPAEVAKAYIYPDPDYLNHFLAGREQKIEALRSGSIAP